MRMTASSSYVHALEGRLRIKVPEVKGAPLKACEVERHLVQSPGVDEVSASSTTGSVLILYNSRLIGQEELLFALQEIGCLQGCQLQAVGGADPASTPGGALAKVTSAVASTLMEVALTRLVIALI
jgi:hypothetical protein